MSKIVINRCYGGFSISREAAAYMAERGHAQAAAELTAAGEGNFYGFGHVNGFDDSYKRDDPLLVEAVETLGDAANGSCSRLTVEEIPDGVEWQIEEYDGFEHVAESHRTWS